MGGRPTISRVYGYLACLVALITCLICINAIVFAAFDLSDPLHARGDLHAVRALSSLENFRVETIARTPPDDTTLASMYDAARSATLRAVRLQSLRTLTASGMVFVVALVIFAGHWRWLRQLNAATEPPSSAAAGSPRTTPAVR